MLNQYIPLLKWVPLGIAFIFILVSRKNHEAQIKLLSAKDKETLYDKFSRTRLIQNMMTILILLALVIPLKLFSSNPQLKFIVFGAQVAVILTWFNFGALPTRVKLRELRFPESYLKAYLLEQVVLVGVLTLFSLYLYFRLF